jgi:hypothetical protein
MADMMTIFFRDADGQVRPVTLPASDARLAVAHHRTEWSATRDGFAPAPASVKVAPEPEDEAASAPSQVD